MSHHCCQDEECGISPYADRTLDHCQCHQRMVSPFDVTCVKRKV
jgi:hypothetical protein